MFKRIDNDDANDDDEDDFGEKLHNTLTCIVDFVSILCIVQLFILLPLGYYH